jgi:hypothetical protein
MQITELIQGGSLLAMVATGATTVLMVKSSMDRASKDLENMKKEMRNIADRLLKQETICSFRHPHESE